MLSYFSFGETGTEGGASKEDAACWGTGLNLSLAKSKEDGEHAEARNSKWLTVLGCAVDYILQ